jgi:hypothetical protein
MTEPSGASHYLVDPDTHRRKIRQRHGFLSGQAASYVERSRMAARMEAMVDSRSLEEMGIPEDDDDDDDSAPLSYNPGHSTGWWHRWRRLLLGSWTQQPQPLLPMYRTDSSFDIEKVTLLGYDGVHDERDHGDRFVRAHSPGFMGALRGLTCCSKS